MTSKFYTIPYEMVATDGAAVETILGSLKCKSNQLICTALLIKANSYGSEGTNQYKAEAYRRAAILVARTDFQLLKKENITWNGWQVCEEKVGLPNKYYSSTSEFIYQFIQTHMLKRDVFMNKYEIFPPEWRKDGLLDDEERMALAGETINWFVMAYSTNHQTPSRYDMWRRSEREPLFNQAYRFYSKFNYEQILFLEQTLYHIQTQC